MNNMVEKFQIILFKVIFSKSNFIYFIDKMLLLIIKKNMKIIFLT